MDFGPRTTAEGRSLALDLVRCSAVGLLLVSHIAGTIGSPLGNAFGIQGLYHVTLGGLAVTVFLILSGAVLQWRYGGARIDYPRFVFKRFLRIYPVYYLALSFATVALVVRIYYDTGRFLAGFPSLGVQDVALSITGAYAFAGRWGGPILGTSWYIAVIITMYLLFPALSRAIEKHPLPILGVTFLISILSRLVLGKYALLPNRPLDWFPLCRLFEFSLGIVLAVMVPRGIPRRTEIPRIVRWATSLVSRASFPLFLIHYPLLFMITLLSSRGIDQPIAIGIYLLISVALSLAIMMIDGAIPRTRILKRFDGILDGRRLGRSSP